MKKVLLVTSDFMNINILMQNELKSQYDLSVVLYPFSENNFKYKNKRQRIKNFFFKLITQNNNYKKKLVKDHIEEMLNKQLDSFKQEFDFALVLNVDFYSSNFLIKIKNRTNKMIAYQYDGLNRTPSIYNKINHFDKFYVFNKADADNSKLFFTTNFFFNVNHTLEFSKESEFYYLGSFLQERVEVLNPLIDMMEKLGYKANINLFSNKNEVRYRFKDSKINISNVFLNYHENLQQVFNSKIVVDLKLSMHDGLSFRFFECLQMEKKLITTNDDVKYYDFYHPNNIFILDENNLHELENFVTLPYIKMKEEIVNQYNFKYWIKNVLSDE